MTDDPWRFQRWAFGVKTGNVTRKAVLSMLAMMADSESGRCEAKQDTLAKGVEAGKSTVAGHLKALEAAGMIARREQRRYDGGRRSDEFLLRAPWVEAWPDGEPLPDPPAESEGGARNGEAPPSGAEGQERPLKNDHAQGKVDSAPADAWPDDLPPELETVALDAGKVLKRTAIARGQRKEVTRAAVGHAVLTYPDRDHVKVAREVEAWLLHGKGARRSCSDIVARYRRFLEGSDPMAGPPLPGMIGGRPSGPSSPSSNISTVEAMAEELRRQGR